MVLCKRVIMKCPRYELTKTNKMEKSSAAMAAAESKVHHQKVSPVKEPIPVKPQCPPAEVTTQLFSLNNNTRAVHNKENSVSREHDRTLDEVFEDSGYLSLHNSQINEHYGDEEDYSHINDHHGDEEDHIQGKSTATPPSSAGDTNSIHPAPVEPSAHVHRSRRGAVGSSLSSTPSNHHSDPNLPILNFQRAVCEELAKSYRKNKRYDWSIVTKVAEDHLLDRVIGGQMGLEYVDIFSSLLFRNMRSILTNILALLGDMDLISCKKVSRTWRRIICEDAAALSRCQQAKETLREDSKSCLTRDIAASRVVLSCVQTLASSSTSSSSSSSTRSCKVNRRTTPPEKGSTPNSQCTRFGEYVQAASCLKQHESLRPCKRCGSPATRLPEVQRATCTRLSCQFDFCTHCQEAFHGSTPCRVVQPRSHFPSSKTTQIIPGSARSKRNIRRL